MNQTMICRTIDSPCGTFSVALDSDMRLRTGWMDDPCSMEHPGSAAEVSPSHRRLLDLVADLVSRYFTGQRVDFSEYAGAAIAHAPPFFRRCLEQCAKIPRGEVRTYRELALLAGGSASAARAAGQAMRHNPVPIVVPCHRVVGTGWFGGFAGSCARSSPPVIRKRILLELEGVSEA